MKHSVPFTTSYTTKLPEYFRARGMIPTAWTYAVMRWFHRPAAGVMVSTDTLHDELTQRGFRNLVRWGRGVDLQLFRPQPKEFLSAPRPILMYVGRVAVEKNIEKFLRLDMPGTKYVVGEGPQLKQLERKYPEVAFRRRPAKAKTWPALCRGRRVRVSQPHRHVWPGAAGSAGQRGSRGGLSGPRPVGRGGRFGSGRVGRGPGSRGPQGAADFAGPVPAVRPAI